MHYRFVFITLFLSAMSSSVLAEKAGQHCATSPGNDFLPDRVDSADSAIEVTADDAQLVTEGTSVFTGDVVISGSGQQLTADRVTYNQFSGDISAQGNVQIRDNDYLLSGEQAEWKLTRDAGSLLGASYRIKTGHIRGNAESIFRQVGQRTVLKNASYTSCEPDDNAWLLTASNVKLDHIKQVGTAHDATIKLADIPVFYTPYISFPLSDKRKSGFLMPSLGSSDETGFDLQTPYYWNIAPDKDATFTPRYMADRGLMLNGEFRYLTRRHQGKFDIGFLANDQLKHQGNKLNPNYQEDRKHFAWQHSGYFASGWSASVDYNYLSDKDYLEDFGTNLTLASKTHLNRRLNVAYTGNNWKFTGRLQGYQTLTDASKPYQRLPQLLFEGSLPDQALGLNYGIKAEYVDFDHNSKIAGSRINIQPSVTLPWSSAAAYIKPRLALHYTQYRLTDNVTSAIDKTPTRTAPVLSVDSGLFFDRAIKFGQTNYTHTLEPRLFYLYIPQRNQTDIPVFDSSLRTFNMGQLFAYDRFSGADRLGDANQISLAVTSRIIDQQTGRETLRASLGQIHYFTDREVSLNNTEKQTDSNSDMIAEVVASLAQEWTMRGELQWDPTKNQANMSLLRLQYHNPAGGLFNITHRYRRDNITTAEGLEQIDISTRLPLNKQWSLVGRWYKSLKESRTLETLAGVEYDSCCWATRFLIRDYVNDSTDNDRNLSVLLQIELKGLGEFGQKADALLEKSILGYDAEL